MNLDELGNPGFDRKKRRKKKRIISSSGPPAETNHAIREFALKAYPLVETIPFVRGPSNYLEYYLISGDVLIHTEWLGHARALRVPTRVQSFNPTKVLVEHGPTG